MTPEESKMFAEFVRSEMSLNMHPGMSLRDWFAGQFLTTVEIIGVCDAKEISSACYKMADAMLEAREGK
jgi:hypothetical protein